MPSQSPDAIVIGAGIIGSSIAWKLAGAGLRVTLLDAGQMGGEASWAGAGMLAPGGEVKIRDAWSDLALESLQMYPEYIAELEAATGVRWQREVELPRLTESPGMHPRHYAPRTPFYVLEAGAPRPTGNGCVLEAPASST